MATSDFRPDAEIWPFSHCGLGYEADTMFRRTYFYFLNAIFSILLKNCNLSASVSNRIIVDMTVSRRPFSKLIHTETLNC